MPVGVTSCIIVSNSVNDFKSVFRVRWHFWNYLRCVTYHGISSDNDGNSTSLPCGHIIRLHYDAMVWNRFLHYWPCLQGLVVPFPKRQWCGDFFFFLGGGGGWGVVNCWTNGRVTSDLRHHGPHFDMTVMLDKIKPHLTGIAVIVQLPWYQWINP